MPRKSKMSSWERKGASIGGNIGAIAERVKNIITEVNAEKHTFYQSNSTNFNSTGAVDNITVNIPLGVTTGCRVGNSIKYLGYHQHANISQHADDINTLCREILFVYNEDEVPTVLNILQTAHPNSYYNVDNTQNFKVFSDRKFLLKENSNSSAMLDFNKTWKHPKSLHGKWKEAGTANDFESGQIYRLMISDTSSNTGSSYRQKIQFYDN